MSSQKNLVSTDTMVNSKIITKVPKAPLMSITLLVKRPRRLSIVNLGMGSFILTTLFFGLLAGGLVGGGVYYGMKNGKGGNEMTSVSDFRGQLDDQQKVIDSTLKKYQEDMNAMALRLGQMQAHVVRLDAVGKRLIKMANLDRGEFDFAKSPARGGPSVAPEEDVDVTEFKKTLAKLSQQLADRTEQLEVLESLILNRKLQKEVFPSGWPIKKGWVSSYFGMRTDPFSGRRARHEGIDFAGRDGSPIISVAAGVVSFSGKRYGYGTVVEINHGNGYVTRYAHNKKNLVNVGDRVKKGQTLALMGSSGRSTGPHTHFEVLKDGQVVNPAKYIQAVR